MTITILIVLKDNHNVYKLNANDNNNNNNNYSSFIKTLLGSKTLHILSHLILAALNGVSVVL